MSKNPKERTARRGGLKGCLAAAVAAMSLALPAVAAGHPAVYDVTRKVDDNCDWATEPAGEKGKCLKDGAERYVVVNHNIPILFEEDNGLDGTHGGVINFQRIPGGAYRDSVPAKADWLTIVPGQTGVQAHATCEADLTTNAENVVGWQGEEPFYAYVPWQDTSAGIDDDPAEWTDYVEALTGVDLAGMDAAQAQAACETLDRGAGDGVYRKSDKSLGSAPLASGLVAHEVEHAVAPLQAEVDAWKARASSSQGQVAGLTATRTSLESELAASSRANAKLRKANARQTRTIGKLRRQLRAGHHG